jgi:hypothetical protein
MLSIKSGLFGCVVAAFVGTFAVVGCSASGETGDITPATENDPTEGSGNTLPPSNPGADDDDDSGAPPTGGGKKDAGKDASKDAAKDSGAPPPAPGDACTTVDQKFKKSCGKCGFQEALCLPSMTVSDYGSCTGEVGLCTPGETAACGNCGTKTCSNTCNWGACGGQPANSCSPGAQDYTGAGCSTAQTYRERVCSATCAWGNYSTTCSAPNNANKLTIPATATASITGNYTLAASKVGSRAPAFGCPGSATPGNYPYEIVELKNETAKTAKVSAWLSGPTEIDTVLTSYATNLPPTTDQQVGACTASNDQCPTSGGPCASPWSILTGASAVTIPPGQVVLLRIASYYELDDVGETTTGAVTLTVRTDELN